MTTKERYICESSGFDEETEDLKVRGIVKWFDAKKGYGFITDSDDNDVFVHQKQIKTDGYRSLHEGDIVDYELGVVPGNSRIQAIKVEPVITLSMVEKALQEENLHLQSKKDMYGNKVWLVIDENNFIQSGEQGLPFYEVAAFAGFDVEKN